MMNDTEKIIEHRILAALRSTHPLKCAELVTVIEAMAAAFPKVPAPTKKQPASLRLVVNDRNRVRVGKRPGHDKQGVLPTVSLSTVLAK